MSGLDRSLMGLSADKRLRRSAEFRHVLNSSRQQGRRRTGQGAAGGTTGGRAGDRLLLIAAVPNGRPGPRFGLSVGKRVGGSVVRNRVKRRLREIFGQIGQSEQAEGEPGWDVVATARPEAAEATFDELRTSAQTLISKVKARR